MFIVTCHKRFARPCAHGNSDVLWRPSISFPPCGIRLQRSTSHNTAFRGKPRDAPIREAQVQKRSQQSTECDIADELDGWFSDLHVFEFVVVLVPSFCTAS